MVSPKRGDSLTEVIDGKRKATASEAGRNNTDLRLPGYIAAAHPHATESMALLECTGQLERSRCSDLVHRVPTKAFPSNACLAGRCALDALPGPRSRTSV